MKWPVKKIGEILSNAELFTDGDWVESKDQDTNGNIRLLQLADIGDGRFVNKSNRFINESTFIRLKCTEVQQGDILIARMPDPLGRACIFEGITKKCITVVDVCIIRVNRNFIDARWLMHAINSDSVRNQILSFAKGATRVRISRKNISHIKIEFPPLAEQQRIAAMLDTADRILKQRESAIAKLDELEQSIFTEFFNMSETDEISIADMLSKKILLLHKDGNHGSYYPKSDQFGDVGVPFLTAKCISESGQINDTSIELLNNESAKKLTIGWIEDGDVLLAHNASVGKVALYTGIYEKALIGTSLTAFRPNPKYLSSDYLYAALRSTKFQSQLTKNMGQTTRNQVPITAQRRLSFCIPSLALQLKFSEQMKQIRIQRLDQMHAAAKVIKLVSSLQHQSFAVN
jgi:type I restriction enzyme S subunit